MNFEVKFTPEAEETYDAVVTQLFDRWGEAFVKKFEARVSKAINIISSTPQMYPVIEDNTKIRRCVLHKNCSMLYKVSDRVVVVVCFWDNRQEPIFS